MKAPPLATITIQLDTDRWRMMREGERHGAMYLVDRLLGGEAVADAELDHLGLSVTVAEAPPAAIRNRT